MNKPTWTPADGNAPDTARLMGSWGIKNHPCEAVINACSTVGVAANGPPSCFFGCHDSPNKTSPIVAKMLQIFSLRFTTICVHLTRCPKSSSPRYCCKICPTRRGSKVIKRFPKVLRTGCATWMGLDRLHQGKRCNKQPDLQKNALIGIVYFIWYDLIW